MLLISCLAHKQYDPVTCCVMKPHGYPSWLTSMSALALTHTVYRSIRVNAAETLVCRWLQLLAERFKASDVSHYSGYPRLPSVSSSPSLQQDSCLDNEAQRSITSQQNGCSSATLLETAADRDPALSAILTAARTKQVTLLLHDRCSAGNCSGQLLSICLTASLQNFTLFLLCELQPDSRLA